MLRTKILVHFLTKILVLITTISELRVFSYVTLYKDCINAYIFSPTLATHRTNVCK
jgi:hypothetical protein